MNRIEFGYSKEHIRRNVVMLLETFFIFSLFFSLCWFGYQHQQPFLLWFGIIGQGIWLQRIYCVGHEASHQKLFPNHAKSNDGIGQLFLWLLFVPLPIFRKIHHFHHSSNRKDERTSALDVYVIPQNASNLRRFVPYVLWYAGIALGGWFFHSLVSIVLFLFLPLKTAQKVSPAFNGWKRQDQLLSILMFSVPVFVHWIGSRFLGFSLWLYIYGFPFLVFAFVYSLQLYVYHYRTTIGSKTLFHARRLTGSKIISWWLLNLNEHDTHHQRPNIVWYQLPSSRKPLPPEFAENQNVETFTQGVLQQFKGPTIVEL